MAKRNPSPQRRKRAPSARQPKNRSSVRHTRAIQRDRIQRPPSLPLDEQTEQYLTDVIHPATLNQVAHFHRLGLRQRLLTLPVMVALVLTMIWRQIGSVATLVRMLRDEGFLWNAPVPVSEQALSLRLRTFPAALFAGVFQELLPTLRSRWEERERPLAPGIAWARARYTAVLAVDGSTLDALMRKVGLLRDAALHPLAGRITALLDLGSRLPQELWYEENAQAHDQRFWPQILQALRAGTLLVLDAGYTNFRVFLQLTAAQVTFITRAKSNLGVTVERVLLETTHLRDALIWIGEGAERQQVRLIQVLVGGTWYRYLTNGVDPEVLPPLYVVALYRQRWRIEDAFAIVKRLLGLAYLWTGSINGVQLQVWATWILYAVLIDLTDAVAQALNRPFTELSVEMVYRSVYHFTQAYHRGAATDPVAYLAANADWLGIVKRKRKKSPSDAGWPDLTFPSDP
jgi:DDE family transposase